MPSGRRSNRCCPNPNAPRKEGLSSFPIAAASKAFSGSSGPVPNGVRCPTNTPAPRLAGDDCAVGLMTAPGIERSPSSSDNSTNDNSSNGTKASSTRRSRRQKKGRKHWENQAWQGNKEGGGGGRSGFSSGSPRMFGIAPRSQTRRSNARKNARTTRALDRRSSVRQRSVARAIVADGY